MANFKLETGIERLDEWSSRARQVEKNHLYKALFAVTDGSVWNRYGVLRDKENPHAYFVLVRDDLVLKVQYRGDAAFGIIYIGSLAGAPLLDLAIESS
jgi:hypothetical protein